jgi:ABC-type uncharacterized transport system involved in gliding motility auxiliary subunit
VEGLTVKRILGLLGWLGVVLVLAAVAVRFIKPERQALYQGLALAGLVATALYALSQWRDIGRSFSGRNVRYGSIAAGSVVLVLGILVAINYVSNREHKRWDLTAAKQFSLSEQTTKILTDLNKPLVITAFHQTGSVQNIRDRLSEFVNVSKLVSVEYIDADRDPISAKKFDIQQYGTLVFQYDGRTEKTTSLEEQDLANTLKKLVEGKAKKVYVVQGHGEHDPDGTDRRGYSGFGAALKGDNFDVAKLTLAQVDKVPDDATLLVIAGPQTDYFPSEVAALRGFLTRGGKVLMMIDPPDKADAPQPTSLIALAREWGVDIGNDMVIDASGIGRIIGTDASVPVAMPAPGGHPIVDKFQLMTAFPLTRSVSPVTGGVNGRTAQKLVETSPNSWAETDLKGLFATHKPELNVDKGDKPGPVSIAVAVSAAAPEAPAPASPGLPKPETRLVVVGDSDFISNAAIRIQGNEPLALNMSNWLAQQENMITIHPRNAEDRRITLTQDQSQRIFWLTLFIIPGLLLANGVRVWWRRR